MGRTKHQESYENQESMVVWPQCGQVCCRSPSRHGLKTAVHFVQKSDGIIVAASADTECSGRIITRFALGSCQRTDGMPWRSRNSTSWPRLIRVITSETTSGGKPREESAASRSALTLRVMTSHIPPPSSVNWISSCSCPLRNRQAWPWYCCHCFATE